MAGNCAQDSCVRVAVRVRPLLGIESVAEKDGFDFSTTEDSISVNESLFKFDRVFSEEKSTSELYADCVRDLKNAFLEGYNCTVFAYGQTGSGKTFTMGTGFRDFEACFEKVDDANKGKINFEAESENGDSNKGCIGNDSVLKLFTEDIYDDFNDMMEKEGCEINLKVSFCEIYNNTIKDLLNTSNSNLVIRETRAALNQSNKREIKVVGLTENPVYSKDDVEEMLRLGSFSRTTGSTAMNSHSSRSHAILTFSLKRVSGFENSQDVEKEVFESKFHFVDLAGSERQKKTNSKGDRLRESIEINTGLLALGNVISALGNSCLKGKRKFIPFRDSKITRLLEDSLGGNSKTLMLACVSPFSESSNETLNTLSYANRAKNIENKPYVNKGAGPLNLKTLQKKIRKLERYIASGNKQLLTEIGIDHIENEKLKKKLREAESQGETFLQRLIVAEKQRDVVCIKYNRLVKGLGDASPCSPIYEEKEQQNEYTELVETYRKRITELELELEKWKEKGKLEKSERALRADPKKSRPLIPFDKKFLLASTDHELQTENERVSKLTSEIEKYIEENTTTNLPEILKCVEDIVDCKTITDGSEYTCFFEKVDKKAQNEGSSTHFKLPYNEADVFDDIEKLTLKTKFSQPPKRTSFYDFYNDSNKTCKNNDLEISNRALNGEDLRNGLEKREIGIASPNVEPEAKMERQKEAEDEYTDGEESREAEFGKIPNELDAKNEKVCLKREIEKKKESIDQVLKKILFRILFEMQRKKILIGEFLKSREEHGKVKKIYENRIEELKFEVNKVEKERDDLIKVIKIESKKSEEIMNKKLNSNIRSSKNSMLLAKKKFQEKKDMLLLSAKDNRIRKLKVEIDEFKKSKVELKRKSREESLKIQHKMNSINQKLKTEIKNKRKLDAKFKQLQIKYEKQKINLKYKTENNIKLAKKLKTKEEVVNSNLNRKKLVSYFDEIDNQLKKLSTKDGEKYQSEIDTSFFNKSTITSPYLKEIIVNYLNKFLSLRRKYEKSESKSRSKSRIRSKRQMNKNLH